jgi:hypothetical protein
VAEDLLFVRKLKNVGKIRMTAETANTSPRRWEQNGFITTFIHHQLIILASLIPPIIRNKITSQFSKK